MGGVWQMENWRECNWIKKKRPLMVIWLHAKFRIQGQLQDLSYVILCLLLGILVPQNIRVKRVNVSWFSQRFIVTNLQYYPIILQGSQVQVPTPTECVYPRSPALGLGLTASVALMVAQIIINVASGCVCCQKGQHQSASNWTLALICFVVSW